MRGLDELNQRTILLSSPKGGVGKSSLARNILVLAARSGKSVAGIDFDQQATLATWTQRRERVRASIPELSAIPVTAAPLDDWRSVMRAARKSQADLVVIDTPPSIELNLSAIVSLSKEANLILVPCQQTQDDVDSAGPWMKRLIDAKANAAFVLNRSNRRAKSFGSIRAKLLALGPVCPVEVPQLEEIPLAAGKGLGVMDLARPSSGETFDSLWSYLAREIGL
jgi:chromosome partitioning protein